MRNKLVGVCLLMLFAVMSCTACGKEQVADKYEFEADGHKYEIDHTKGIIKDEVYNYFYTITTVAGEDTIEIKYPDGVVYTKSKEGSSLFSPNGTRDVDSKFAKKETLLKEVEKQAAKDEKHIPLKAICLALVCLLIGVLEILRPDVLWRLSGNWKSKTVQTSQEWNKNSKMAGIALVAVAVIICVCGFIFN